MEQIAGAFDKPVLINIVEGGKTPVLSREQLQAMGFRLAIYPGTGFLAMGKALEDAYSALLQDGSSAAVADRLYDFESFSRLMGFQAVWDFDKAHADD